MRFRQGSQSRCSISIAFVLFGTSMLPCASCSFAQEDSGYAGNSLAIDGALETGKAGGRSPSASELKELLYTIAVVEVLAEKAKPIIEDWNLLGSSTSVRQEANSGLLPNTAVLPASFKASTKATDIWMSDSLSEEQVNEVVRLGKLISSPTIVGQNGVEVSVLVGREVPFVTSYEPVENENGNDSTTMQPKVVNVLDGIKLDLNGDLDDKEEHVLLRFKFTHSQLEGMGEPYTYDSKYGPLTVQQPEFSATGIENTCHAPTNKTFALCSGPIVRQMGTSQKLPLIGRMPYVGELFKNTSTTTELISTVVLVRCRRYRAASRQPLQRQASPLEVDQHF